MRARVPSYSCSFSQRASCTVGAFGVEGSLPSFSRSVHPCVSAESLTPRSDRPSLSIIKVPFLKVQVGSGRFREVPHTGSILRS